MRKCRLSIQDVMQTITISKLSKQISFQLWRPPIHVGKCTAPSFNLTGSRHFSVICLQDRLYGDGFHRIVLANDRLPAAMPTSPPGPVPIPGSAVRVVEAGCIPALQAANNSCPRTIQKGQEIQQSNAVIT